MGTIVTAENLDDVLDGFRSHNAFAIDTETTGLRAYKGDKLFSLIVATERDEFYFNFQPYPEHQGLDRRTVLERLDRQLFSNTGNILYLANAKFDMHMLAKEGVELQGTVHCTMVHERLIFNKLMSYALGSIATRYGFQKSNAVDKYITKHKLFTKVEVPGKKDKVKIPHYDQVPFLVVAPYGCTDGRITFDIGKEQRARLTKFYTSFPPPVASAGKRLVANERELTKVCFEMERRGIKIDRAYCEEAFTETTRRAQAAADRFAEICGEPLLDDKTEMPKILKRAGVTPGRTAPSKTFPTGQESYNKAALVASGSEIAKELLTYRKYTKVANTYYRNFLDFADDADMVHADIRQAGTDTGRFSMSEPNLQNLKRNEDEEATPGDADADDTLDEETTFQVRRAFVPDSPDYCLTMIDYDQQEYRMMLDLAGEMGLIEKVLAGLDVHTATAQMVGIERYPAKTLNFLLLYGGGAAKLAGTLNMPLEQAKGLIQKYFADLPAVKRFIRSTIREAETKGMLRNWAGRCYHFDRGFEYKGPNTVIQGGGADVMRFAMITLARYLKGRKSQMKVTVHDELVFGVHRNELAIVPDLKHIMESVYPHRHLPLTCSVSHSWKSWADKEKGPPT